MKRKYKNSDIKFYLSDIKGISDKFIIKFYTTNKDFNIKKTDQDVIIETITDEFDNVCAKQVLKLNWNELETIGEGVLNYVVNNIASDSDYDDGIYNNTFSKTTEYYINSNLNVEEEGDTSFSEIISDISNRLENEITRSTEKDTEHDTAISDLNEDLEIETDARGAADLALQANIDTEKTRATTRENTLENVIKLEETARINKDKELSDAIDALQTKINEDVAKIDKVASGLTQEIEQKANIGDSYTKAESDSKYLTEHQDISALATKAELNTVQTNLTTEIENEAARARTKEVGLSGQIYDIEQTLSIFEKKTDHEADINDLDDRVTAIIANTYNKTQIQNAMENLKYNLQTNIDLKANSSDVYTKTESDAKYLTEHQDISALATKAELQSEATDRQNADTILQNNIDALSTTITTLQTDLDEKELVVSASLNDLKSNIDALSTTITTLQTDLDDKEDFNIIDCGEY